MGRKVCSSGGQGRVGVLVVLLVVHGVVAVVVGGGELGRPVARLDHDSTGCSEDVMRWATGGSWVHCGARQMVLVLVVVLVLVQVAVGGGHGGVRALAVLCATRCCCCCCCCCCRDQLCCPVRGAPRGGCLQGMHHSQ